MMEISSLLSSVLFLFLLLLNGEVSITRAFTASPRMGDCWRSTTTTTRVVRPAASVPMETIRNEEHGDDDGSRGRSFHHITHLNHAGASPSSTEVIQRVTEYMQDEQRYGGYAAADRVSAELDSVYERIADFIGVPDDSANKKHTIALTESATVGWTRLFYAMAKFQNENTKKRRIILISEAEYAANVVAACKWAKENENDGWNVWTIPSQPLTGKVDCKVFQDMLEGRYEIDGEPLNPADIALVCVTHVPTNSGIINPVWQIGSMIANYNDNNAGGNDGGEGMLLYQVDACQSVGQMYVSVQDIQCHGLVATGRKFLRGPRGTGFLYCCDLKKLWLVPDHVDHYCMPIQYVPESDPTVPLQHRLQFHARYGAQRFEFWESNIGLKLGLGLAVQEVAERGIDEIANTILQAALYLYDSLEQMSKMHPALRLYYRPECGIVTFWIDGVPAESVQEFLWKHHNIEVSVVPKTSTPVDSSVTEVPDLIRASVSYMTSSQAVDRLTRAVQEILVQSSGRNAADSE